MDAWVKTWLHPDFSKWSLESHLRNILCPVLAIHGSEDEYVTEACPKRIAELVATDAEALILDGIGHVPHKEVPSDIIAATEKFLSAADI